MVSGLKTFGFDQPFAGKPKKTLMILETILCIIRSDSTQNDFANTNNFSQHPFMYFRVRIKKSFHPSKFQLLPQSSFGGVREHKYKQTYTE